MTHSGCANVRHGVRERSTRESGSVESIRTEDGLITLKGSRLSTVVGDVRTSEVLPDEAAILAAYRKYFGFHSDKLPVEPASAITTGVRPG